MLLLVRNFLLVRVILLLLRNLRQFYISRCYGRRKFRKVSYMLHKHKRFHPVGTTFSTEPFQRCHIQMQHLQLRLPISRRLFEPHENSFLRASI